MSTRLDRVVAALRRRPLDVPSRRRGASRNRDDVRIEVRYQPRTDGRPDPGEVVWAWIPFEEDPRQGKDRPTVVIGTAGELLVVVMLTSKPHPEERDQVAVGAGAWDHDGRVSYARLDRLIGLRPGQVRREGATLDRRRFDALVAQLARRKGWPMARLEVPNPS